MRSDTPLAGKRAILTGAASGLGAAILQQLLRDGAQVLATDINEQGLAQAEKDTDSEALTTHPHDVTDIASWDRVIDAAFAAGPCDILINNAGIADVGSYADMTLERFQRISKVNLLGPFSGSKRFIAALRAASDGPARGAIVNMTSVLAKRLMPGVGAYSTSKAALGNLTKALAVELGRKGDFIRVNAVAPGPVRTAMLEGMDPRPWDERDHSVVNAIPLKRYGQKEEVARAVAFLASDRAKFMTGHTIEVDGGMSGL